jgi:hypothetical protein
MRLSSEERKSTMRFVWPMMMSEVKSGIQYRIEVPEIVEFSPDSTACEIYYDRVEFDAKKDTIRTVRRDYTVIAEQQDGKWVLHSGSDNPFPRMIDEHPDAMKKLEH